MPKNQHKILVLTTGGTIAGNVAKPKSKSEEDQARHKEDLQVIVAPVIASLRDASEMDITIEFKEICDVDSSNIMPLHWTNLANKIKEEYDNYTAFVITHGTNTLGYTCAALSFAIANSDKPIILTGSQVPAGLPGSDALTNLENSIRIAVWEQEGLSVKGVVAVFGSHVITGTRVKKSTEFDYDAFKSFGIPSLGRIGRIIDMNPVNLDKHNSYLKSNKYRIARDSDELICISDFDVNIASITEFPGMSSDLLLDLVGRTGARGLILRAFGAGDPCTNHLDALRDLKRDRIPVVITTQAPNGNSNFQVNEPGQKIKNEGLGIAAYDMSIESQTTKLSWLLAQYKKRDITYENLCDEMTHDIRGEISVMWEL